MSKRLIDCDETPQKRAVRKEAVLCALHGVLTAADNTISVQLTDGTLHAPVHVCENRRCATCSVTLSAGDLVALRRSANGLRYDQIAHAACTQPHGAIQQRCECHARYTDPCKLVPVSFNNGMRQSHVCTTTQCDGCSLPITAGSKLVRFKTPFYMPSLCHERCAPPCHFCQKSTITRPNSTIHACEACRVSCLSCGHDITAISRRIPLKDGSWRCHGCAAKIAGSLISPQYCCELGSQQCRDRDHPVTRTHMYDPISNSTTSVVVCNKLLCETCERPLYARNGYAIARLKTGELVCDNSSLESPCFRECGKCGGGFIPGNAEIGPETLCRDCTVVCCACGVTIFDSDGIFGPNERPLCHTCHEETSSLDSGSEPEDCM